MAMLVAVDMGWAQPCRHDLFYLGCQFPLDSGKVLLLAKQVAAQKDFSRQSLILIGQPLDRPGQGYAV